MPDDRMTESSTRAHMEVGYFEIRHPIIVYREPESQLWTAECHGTSIAALGETLDEAIRSLQQHVNRCVNQGATGVINHEVFASAERQL